MPEIGEVRSDREIGRRGTHNYVWHACIDCGKERWVGLRHNKVRSPRCKSCATRHLANNPWRARGEMPDIGERREGKDIGKNVWGYFIWHACPGCGRESWVREVRGQLVSLRCKSCAAKMHLSNNWKGGRVIMSDVYIGIRLSKNDFFYPMVTRDGYVMEHRLVVAKGLGRCLHRWEIVHHKHAKYPAGSIEDKQDNRYPENLQLVSDDRHKQITILETRIAFLEKRIVLLEAENIILKQENREKVNGE